jgi:hypothetical protein
MLLRTITSATPERRVETRKKRLKRDGWKMLFTGLQSDW